jgi:hypothetical protein
MKNMQFVVGGEPTISLSSVFSKRTGEFSKYGSDLQGYNRYYTFGAYYSLKVIIESLNWKTTDFVLLPSYLCPSILMPFKEAGVRYKFFKMLEGLEPDTEDIRSHMDKDLRAILFIDYFGYPYRDILSPFLDELHSNKTMIIQDTVQSWLDNQEYLYGDVCFNSVRKYTPYEGSVLLSKKTLEIKHTRSCNSSFVFHKRFAQHVRHYHLKYGWFKPRTFLKHIDMANSVYHQPGIINLPSINHFMLNKLDFDEMARNRKQVYDSLLMGCRVKPLLKHPIDSFVPLGLAIYVENRNEVRSELFRHNVYCPIHWLLSSEIDKKCYAVSCDVQDHELTLPISIDPKYIERYIIILNEVLM